MKAGRFGEYVTDGEYNATLRKDDTVEAITLERAAELLAERRERGPAKKAAKKGAKKAPAKKTAKKTRQEDGQEGRQEVVTAYWVSEYREITDETRMTAYAALGRPALEAAGGRFLARSLPEQLYEAGVGDADGGDRVRVGRGGPGRPRQPGVPGGAAALGDGAVRDIRIVPGSSTVVGAANPTRTTSR